MGRRSQNSGMRGVVHEKGGSGQRKKMTQSDTELIAGSAQQAIDRAKRTLQKDPSHVGALEALAKAQWQTSQCQDLVQTLKRLIELNPYEPGYHSLLAGAYQSLGLCGEAVKSHLRAVDLGFPKSAEMDSMIEELRAWQGKLVAEMMESDPVFLAAYRQDPAKACAEKGFDFAIAVESTDLIIRERETRAGLFARPS